MEFEQLFSNLGSAGIGFAFMYIMLKQSFKMQEVSIEKLCEKIDRLIEEMHKANLHEVSELEKSEQQKELVNVSYLKIRAVIEAQNEKIDKILSLSEKIYGQKLAIGMIAVNKGYMTREQLEECLKDQKDLGGL